MPTLRSRGSPSPFSALNEMRQEMDRLFDAWPAWVPDTPWTIPADVREDDEAIEYAIEIPGLKPEEIELTVVNDVLTVSGEKKVEREGKEEGYHLVERRYGRFERSFRVPTNVKADAVKAAYDHGVLRVTLPKSEESKPRKIQIRAGDGARQLLGCGSRTAPASSSWYSPPLSPARRQHEWTGPVLRADQSLFR